MIATPAAGKSLYAGSAVGVTAMRYRAEKRQDGYWICDTDSGELCFATRFDNQAQAERWVDTLNTAYAAFRDEARLATMMQQHSPLGHIEPAARPVSDCGNIAKGVAMIPAIDGGVGNDGSHAIWS